MSLERGPLDPFVCADSFIATSAAAQIREKFGQQAVDAYLAEPRRPTPDTIFPWEIGSGSFRASKKAFDVHRNQTCAPACRRW